MNKPPLKPARSKPALLLLLSVLFLLTLQARPQNAPVTDPDPARFQNDIDAFIEHDRKNSYPAHAILFVGSSSIRLWATGEAFNQYPVINRGFGGSHISDVNNYFSSIVKKYEPEVIVFYAGDNDIAGEKPASQVYDDYVEFAQKVKTELPETCVIYLPIKPSIRRWESWPAMQETNSMIKAFSDSNDKFYYADLATPMLAKDDGRPLPDLFVEDGLHLNGHGYQLWQSILGPLLETAYASCAAR
jgi:lysophospholipase L1-like esterase